MEHELIKKCCRTITVTAQVRNKSLTRITYSGLLERFVKIYKLSLSLVFFDDSGGGGAERL